jgi:hypothetical protein
MVGMKNQTLNLEKDAESSSFPCPCKDFILIFSPLRVLELQKSGRSPNLEERPVHFLFYCSGG